jgi:hypothetical protein
VQPVREAPVVPTTEVRASLMRRLTAHEMVESEPGRELKSLPSPLGKSRPLSLAAG